MKFAKTSPYSGISECERYVITSGFIGGDRWATVAYVRGRPPALLHRAESDASNAGIAKARADCKASCITHLARKV